MKQLDNFLDNIKEIFGERLKSIFIFGSKAHLETEKLENDINLMVIVDLITGEDLKKCSKPSSKWVKEKNPAPIFMGESEWFNSCDVYAMEYSDIQENHQILHGSDLICSLNVKKEDLRLQCEAETKNLLMRFRAHYLQYAGNAREIEKSIIPVTKTCTAVFKAILRLKDINVPKSHYEIVDRIYELTPINKKLYEKLLCSKEKNCKMKDKEVFETADELVQELGKLLEYINNL